MVSVQSHNPVHKLSRGVGMPPPLSQPLHLVIATSAIMLTLVALVLAKDSVTIRYMTAITHRIKLVQALHELSEDI